MLRGQHTRRPSSLNCAHVHVRNPHALPTLSPDEDASKGAPAGGFLPGPELREYLQRVEDNKAFVLKEGLEGYERRVAGREKRRQEAEKHRLFVTARIQKRRLRSLAFTRDEPGGTAIMSFVHQPTPVSNLFVADG